jgi:RNA polymerase sigma-70 factor (ECF subfamily)
VSSAFVWLEDQAAASLRESRVTMNLVEDDESQLVVLACQGSITAFEALVRIYEPRIRRMIYGLTQDTQLTQDLCQETFLAVFKALPRMNGAELRFAPWLYRIALNQVRSEWRRRKYVSVISFFSLNRLNEEDSLEEGEDSLASPEHFEEQVAERDVVRLVLAQLPQSSVACLLLDAEGFSYSEIAEILQETLSAVRSRISRARRAFQRLYARLDQEKKDEG